MRGPKPIPTAIKRRRGNPGKRPLNAAEPQIAAVGHDFDIPPAELDGEAVACAEWRRMAPILRESRAMTEADRGALLSLCIEWATYLEAKRKITALVVTTKTGHPMPNPFRSVANRALANCIKLWDELGCTPSSRSRVKVEGDAPAVDPIEHLLSADIDDSDHAH
jgi:P27 family predicted phage terminase small subunit